MNEKMTCIIVDDEPVARKGLSEYVQSIDFLSLVGVCENAFKAAEVLTKAKVQLMFLDIQMPHQSGIEFLKGLSDPPITIFTTAYSEHAVEGFTLDVIDYLVKPIPFDRFKKACQKAYEFERMRAKANASPESTDTYFFVKCDGKFEKIFFNEVLYIEALQPARLRVGCFLPWYLGIETLRLIEARPPLENAARIKVPRSMVYRAMWLAAPVAFSNAALHRCVPRALAAAAR